MNKGVVDLLGIKELLSIDWVLIIDEWVLMIDDWILSIDDLIISFLNFFNFKFNQ